MRPGLGARARARHCVLGVQRAHNLWTRVGAGATAPGARAARLGDGALDQSDERRLLSWVAQRTSFSTIARMLGEQRSAIVKRVTRLRARLIEAALRFGESLGASERAELVRFLRRTGAYDPAALDALARGERQLKGYPMRQPRPRRRGEEPINDIAR